MFRLPKSFRLPTIIIALAISIMAVVTFFSVITQYSDYQFNKASLIRAEEILSAGLLKGAMPFAVASKDVDLISSIVHDHMEFDEIYAVEVRDLDGKILYREEKDNETDIKIVTKSFDIESPFSDIEIDDFEVNSESVSDKENQVLGKLTIYFSTHRLHDTVISQVYITGGVVFLSIIICIFIAYGINSYVSNRLNKLVSLINDIKNNREIDSYKNLEGISEITLIEESLREMVSALQIRDNELKESLEQAMEANRTAKDAEEFRDEFMRRISHDINTPIGSVLNLINMIKDDLEHKDIDPIVKQNVYVCHQSALHLAAITRELFSLEQFQKTELVNKPMDTNISDIFNQISSVYKAKFADKDINYSVNCVNDTRIDENIIIDRSKLLLILENIIHNAYKYTLAGSVTVAWELNVDTLIVKIRDTGVGIKEEDVNSIFEKHKQLGNLVTTPQSGRGLGLYYVEKMLDVMGGEVSVSSKLELGSIFTVKLPYSKLISSGTDESKEQVERESTISALIIDDDENTCYTIARMLEKLNVEASYECIPEIGLARLLDEQPDLVFIDYHMTGLSGDVLVQEAKEMLKSGATFYVCITAEHDQKQLSMLEAHFEVVLRKPIVMDYLSNLIQKVAESKDKTQSIIDKLID